MIRRGGGDASINAYDHLQVIGICYVLNMIIWNQMKSMHRAIVMEAQVKTWLQERIPS